VMPRRESSLSVFVPAGANSLVLHVNAADVPKQWVSPTAERVWHRMKRLKETEFRLWAEEEAAKAKSPWRRFGVYPLVGLGLTAMISKEFGILMLGEYQYIPIFVAAVTGVYVYGRKPIEEFFREGNERHRRSDVEVFDWKIELAKEALSEHRANAQIIELVREYEREHHEARRDMIQYHTVKPRHDWRAATLQKLQAILTKESAEREKERGQIFAGSRDFLLSKIKGDPQLRAQLVAAAIDRVGSPTRLDQRDPLVKIFNDYLTSNGRPPLSLDVQVKGVVSAAKSSAPPTKPSGASASSSSASGAKPPKR